MGRGDLHRHRVPGRRAGHHQAQIPCPLRIFLLTLAVVDDVGALCVIALFYSDSVQVGPLLVSVAPDRALALVRFLPAGARGPAYCGVRVRRCGSRCTWPACIPRWPAWRSRC